MLSEGSYQLQTTDSSGILKSPFFSGLWLDVSALVAGKRQQVLTVLQQGINSSEHQTFVETLSSMTKIVPDITVIQPDRVPKSNEALMGAPGELKFYLRIRVPRESLIKFRYACKKEWNSAG